MPNTAARPAGFEPATGGLEVRQGTLPGVALWCNIRLYMPILLPAVAHWGRLLHRRWRQGGVYLASEGAYLLLFTEVPRR
jgi:hypothetical protein